MATVIELLGGECTGKSALAGALASSLDARVVPEHLREFVDRHSRTPTQDEQASIFRTQREAMTKAIEVAAPGDVVVGDPAALMTAAYSIQYFDDDSLLPVALEATSGTDLLVWCQPDFPWAADGLHRDGPDARERTHRIIEQRIVPVLAKARLVVVDGPLAKRLETVRSSLDHG